MKNKADSATPEARNNWNDIGRHPEKQQCANLTDWISSKQGEKYFGKSFSLKIAVLAFLATPETEGNLADIARAFGVTRAAVSAQARRARHIYKNANGKT